MSEQAIVLNELTKHYGKHRGINNLSFSVNQGEFFGFIGPNGAGKSTTILSSIWTVTPRPASSPGMWAICPARTAITKT